MKNVFQVKTKPHGIQRYEQFISEDKIGIGWPGIQDLSKLTKSQIRKCLSEVYGFNGPKLGNALGAIWAFVETMAEGDLVMIRRGPHLSIGVVGSYRYDESLDNDLDGFCHQRSVRWIIVNEKVALYNQKVIETINHRGIVTKCKYSLDELGLGPEFKQFTFHAC